ncbi:MAG: type II and III secretion system protein family protein [Pseudomonadales bacterium]
MLRLSVKKIHIAIALFLVCSLLNSPVRAQEVINIDMFVGEVRSLGKKSVNRVAVGAGSVLRAEVVSGGELLAIAEGKGSSFLNLWYKDGSKATYNIRVTENDPQQRVQMQDMIRIKVQLVEVRKSASRSLGIDWGNFAQGPTYGVVGDFNTNNFFRGFPGLGDGTNLPLNVEPFSSYFGIATGVTSTLNFLSTRGDALTVAEPTLTCVNGGSAKFLAGGEIPYTTVSANGQVNVEFKEYGVKLDIFPRASKEGNIYTRLKTEISEPDLSIEVLGAPALRSRKTESQLNVRDGETIVISGLLSSESTNDTDAVPGLGAIPLLGKLFSSEEIESNIRELVVFVTPEVVTAESMGGTTAQAALYQDSRERLQKLGKKLKYSIME